MLLGKAPLSQSQTALPEEVLALRAADRLRSLQFLRSALASEIERTAPHEVHGSLLLQRTKIRWIPGNLCVNGSLFATRCQRLRGFSGNSLQVKQHLFIGGSDDLRMPWIGDEREQVSQFGRRVAEFLSAPSTSATCPFSTWPQEVLIGGSLAIANCKSCTELPSKLHVGESISLVNCGIASLPLSLQVEGDLEIDGCPISELPDGLVVSGNLHLRNLPIRHLPNISVGGSLEIVRCPNLKTIPNGVKVAKNLKIVRCNVERIEDSFRVGNKITIRNCPIKDFLITPQRCRALSFQSCDRLEGLSKRGNRKIELNLLLIDGCKSFSSLPEGIRIASPCRLSNLPSLKSLPLDFSAPLFEISGTQIEPIHDSQLNSLRFVFRGVSIPAYAIFAPHKIRVEDVLQQRNAEVRRMMLEQMGIERFEEKSKSMSIDEDTDAGGKRNLLRLQSRRWGANQVYLMCRCPSTGRVYLLQVPEATTTCHAAAAWLAGFDNPDDYQPLIET